MIARQQLASLLDDQLYHLHDIAGEQPLARRSNGWPAWASRRTKRNLRARIPDRC